MTWLALSLALSSSAPAAPSPPVWRLVSTDSVHVGARPALHVSPEEGAIGVTIQVSVHAL
jgi:hypothetical protein